MKSILPTALGIALIVALAMAIILAAMALFRDGHQYAALGLILGSGAVVGGASALIAAARG